MSIYENMLCIYPKVIDDVLYNPGIGFNTFQRFNGDKMNEGLTWTEGYPIDYQEFHGSLVTPHHPYTTTSYFRIYWQFLEPEEGVYNWALIDKALATSRDRKQTMLLRVAPHSFMCEDEDGVDVPKWYRAVVGPHETSPLSRWGVDGNNPYYSQCFGRFIRALGEHYDGHPDLESVDMALIGPWGEGAESYLLKPEYRKELANAYIDSFKKTPLLAMLTDPETNQYILSKTNAGWRVDCLGDMREDRGFCHMLDKYPQQIVICGVADAWKKGPVSMEVCGVMENWHRRGWDIDYIIDQSLKWHISSFNSKSAAVPKEWEPHVERWLKKMGYRFALRHFACPHKLKPGYSMEFYSWWENQGVAPCYRNYPLVFRLQGEKESYLIKIATDIREWTPGDTILNSTVLIPNHISPGTYTIQIAMLSLADDTPVIDFAVEGRQEDGWYTLGKVEVQTEETPTTLPYHFYYE